MSEIFKGLDTKKYDGKHCFLCGGTQKITREHVIPKWLLKRFKLYNQTYSLLNGTSIQYRYLTVPCCKTCNSTYLSDLENNQIRKAFELGFDQFKKIDREKLYLWLGKIFYGFLYRDLSLYLDQTNPISDKITSPELLAGYRAHELFMQGIREKHRFVDSHPASIFLFKTQVPNSAEQQWDYLDNLHTMFIAVRMADIGIVAVLEDGGANEELSPSLECFRKIPLHSIQFRELAAQVTYKSLLFNRVPKYISIELEDHVETIVAPVQGFSDKPVFDEWDMEDYAHVLSIYTGISVEKLNPEADKVMTFIVKNDGSPNFIDVSK